MADVHQVVGSVLGEKDGVTYTYNHLAGSSLRVISASKGALPAALKGAYSSQQDCINAVNRYLHGKDRVAEISKELKVANAKQDKLKAALKASK